MYPVTFTPPSTGHCSTQHARGSPCTRACARRPELRAAALPPIVVPHPWQSRAHHSRCARASPRRPPKAHMRSATTTRLRLSMPRCPVGCICGRNWARPHSLPLSALPRCSHRACARAIERVSPPRARSCRRGGRAAAASAGLHARTRLRITRRAHA
jgi:hypothetical protein